MTDTRNPFPTSGASAAGAAPHRELMVEEGAAFMHMSAAGSAGPAPAAAGEPGVARTPRGAATDGRDASAPGRLDVIVIGGGQAGLSTGYHLARLGMRFVILEANARIGDSWRKRWDSLRLFTPARFDGLDGMPFPAHGDAFPTKDEFADYLEAYVARFDLPVRTGERVRRVTHEDDRYVVVTDRGRYEADHVVVAMATYQQGHVPGFAAGMDPAIRQLHSVEYRNPDQLRDGGVLIVGAGNSGSEIATELVRTGRTVWMSGRDVGHIPFRIEGVAGRKVLVRMVLRGLFHRVLTVGTPIGRRARPGLVSKGGPLIRVKPSDLAAAGVRRVPRVAGVRDGRPVLEDGTTPDVTNVIWCTGFRCDFSWIERPVFDADGEPRHERGVVPDEPGLYFVGLHFLYALSSTMIHGVGRDACHVVERIAERSRAAAA